MNWKDLFHKQDRNVLTVTDKLTGHNVSIAQNLPGRRKWTLTGDNSKVLMDTNVDVVAQQATLAYLEKCRREEGK